LEWAKERNLKSDPGRLGKLYDEARKRWSLTRHEAGKLVLEVLKRLEGI